MTKYLRKQKNLIISETGFKRFATLLLTAMLLLVILYPAVQNDSLQIEGSAGQVSIINDITNRRTIEAKPGEAIFIDSDITNGKTIKSKNEEESLFVREIGHNRKINEEFNAVSWLQKVAEMVIRQNGGRRTLEILHQRIARAVRYLRQLRISKFLVSTMLFSLKHEQIGRYFYAGSSKEKELILRSRLLVDFMRRADGKKNGIFSSIK